MIRGRQARIRVWFELASIIQISVKHCYMFLIGSNSAKQKMAKHVFKKKKLAVTLNNYRKICWKFLQRTTTILEQSKNWQSRTETDWKFELKSEKIATRVRVSRQSSSAYEPQQRLHRLKKDHQPNQEKKMLEKQALASKLETRQDTNFSGMILFKRHFLQWTIFCWMILCPPPGGIREQVTNTILLDDSLEKMQLE